MSLILNIDTATEFASICIRQNEVTLGLKENATPKEHAAFLHVAIKNLVEEIGISLNDLDAVAITSGPGSYTGLRVSMAAAKGLCYALNKPLIAVNTLEVMALAAKEALINEAKWDENIFLCPMLDARRMEVFTAIYDPKLNKVMNPCSMVLEGESFRRYENKNIFFFGSGSEKFIKISQYFRNYLMCSHNAEFLGKIAEIRFVNNIFCDTVYAEPEYLKEFYTTI